MLLAIGLNKIFLIPDTNQIKRFLQSTEDMRGNGLGRSEQDSGKNESIE